MSGLQQFRDFVEQVRAATDIVDVIGKDVELIPAGSTMKGLSPFRSENNPSFTVWPETQSWCDFSGSGRIGGDVFAYIQHKQDIGFKEAVYYLAQNAGIKPPNQDDTSFRAGVALLEERREIEKLLTKAAEFYHTRLPDKIRQNLFRIHYGFSDQIIDDLLLGWADGHLLDNFVKEQGISETLALKTGLFIVTANGAKDFFRNRLVFPYWKRGQVVYFIARVTELTGSEKWELAKYKKQLTHVEKRPYVSTTVQNDFFYNEDAAGAEELLITEGVTDCISAIQAGIPCISPVTTQFRKKDIPKLLELTRRAKKVLICNDNETNGSGAAGALGTAEALFEAGRDVRLVTLPKPEGIEKIDLNEFLKERTSAEFLTLCDSADRYVVTLLHQIPTEISKLDLAERLRPILKQLVMCSPIEQDGYIDLVSKKFDVGKRDLKKIVRELQTEIEKKLKTEQQLDASPDETFRGEVLEDYDHYYIFSPLGGKVVISSFQIEPRERIDFHDDGEVIIGDVTTKKGFLGRVRFPWECWRGNQFFLKILKKVDLQWSGQDVHLQGVLRLLSNRDVPIRVGTKSIGYVETKNGPRWVTKELVLGPDGPVEDDIVFDNANADFPDRVRYRLLPEDDIRSLAQKALPLILELNEPAVILPVLGWFFATPFKPALMTIVGHFPFLMVHGSHGSGKTSLCRYVFWRLFGVTPTVPFSVTDSDFSWYSLFSSSSSIPVFLDEYKTKDMPPARVSALQRILRRLYGGEVERRGRPDQSVSVYRLIAPVCLAGEMRPDNAALVDRMVSAMPDKNRLEQHPEHKVAYQLLEELEIECLAAPYAQFSLTRDVRADYRKATGIADTVLDRVPEGKSASIRCRDNLRITVFGLHMFEVFAERMGAAIPDIDVVPAISACLTDLMDGDGGAKNELDLFVEACSTLAFNKILRDNEHYRIIDQVTCLHLNSCLNVYLEHCKRIGETPAVHDRRALKRMLKENEQRDGYVRERGKLVTINGHQVRTVAIDLNKAAEKLEVDDFPGEVSLWGGSRAPAYE